MTINGNENAGKNKMRINTHDINNENEIKIIINIIIKLLNALGLVWGRRGRKILGGGSQIL